MPPQTRAAVRYATVPTPLDTLPLSVALFIFSLLPVDARLLAAAVCRSWRRMLADRSLWTRLDLSPSSGVTNPTDSLFHAAAARAGGQLEVLRIHAWDQVTFDVLMGVLPANAGSMRELTLSGSALPESLADILRAAPGLRLLETGMHCAGAEALPALRKEPPYRPLRLTRLHLRNFPDDDVRALADSLAAHSSLEDVTLRHPWPVAQADSDALGGALASLPRLRLLSLVDAPASALARLLGCRALKSLHAYGHADAGLAGLGVPLLDSPASAALLRDALRANTHLETLWLIQVGFWHDMDAAASVLAALQAHPSLTELFTLSVVPPEHAAAAGAALGALVSSLSPLQDLDIRGCYLGDAGLGPVMDALPHSRCLLKLDCSYNLMSEAFARERLLPAVRACASLRVLQAASDADGHNSPGVQEAQQLLQQRR